MGTWAFWLLLAVVAIDMSEMLDNNKPGYATVLALATFALFSFFGNLNLFVWVYQHPIETVEYAVGYFAVGAV